MKCKPLDHINHNGLDNQKKNLRKVTYSQNFMNMRGDKNASSIFKGVSFHKPLNKWRGQIRMNYKHYHLGYHLTEVKAARAYNKKAKELFGEYAYLNKIPRKYKTAI